MTYRPKRWTHLGLAAVLLSTTALSACGGEGGEGGEAAGGEAGEGAVHAEMGEGAGEAASAGEAGEGESGEGEGGEAGDALNVGALPLDHRVAFMAGHVAAGLNLYRAGHPELAARHLMHPVSEMHASERGGMDAIGFDPAPYLAVSTALEAGTAAGDITQELSAIEANIALLTDRAGGDPKEVITFLLNTTLDEYKAGVASGAVVNAGEYQDAWGFVQVALETASAFGNDNAEALELQNELRNLADLWPEDITGEEPPASVQDIAAQISVVQLVLSGL